MENKHNRHRYSGPGMNRPYLLVDYHHIPSTPLHYHGKIPEAERFRSIQGFLNNSRSMSKARWPDQENSSLAGSQIDAFALVMIGLNKIMLDDDNRIQIKELNGLKASMFSSSLIFLIPNWLMPVK